MLKYYSHLPLGLALMAAMILSGCNAIQSDDYTYKPAPVTPKKLGNVDFVDMTETFVLVRMNYGYTVEVGTKMYAISSEGKVSALLQRHPDEKKPFAVADILKGNPQVGDSVMVYPDPKLAPDF